MTVSVRRSVSEDYHHANSSDYALPQRKLGGIACTCLALACAWIAWANLQGSAARQPEFEPTTPVAAPPRVTASTLAGAYARLSAAMRRHGGQSVVSENYLALLDPRYLLGSVPPPFSPDATIAADGRSVAAGLGRVTSKLTREISSTLSRADRLARSVVTVLPRPRSPQVRTAAAHDAPAEKPTIFEKLFGKPSATLRLAYAAPDDGGIGEGESATPGRYDRWTAVYDISAHTVYLPDGTKLEAHSGRGDRLDDPRYVDERMRGPTPPDVYDLELREGLFHGVQALRLVPVDSAKVFGRSGLLAHTYMLGPNGDSFGCVSFKDYSAFLRAYLDHKIKRLVVVAGPV